MAIRRVTHDLVVVTGLSGAGKTTALNALSDAGYYCVDNLPPTLARSTVEQCRQGGIQLIALGMDVRVGNFLASLPAAIEQLQAPPQRAIVMYLDASDDALLRRFSESRRPHPVFAHDDSTQPQTLVQGIRLERRRLAAIRPRANLLIDTSHMSVHVLRKQLLMQLTGAHAATPMTTRIVSFGFKHGIPLDANLVFDVRFIDNPYFVPQLRPLSGEDPAVSAFVLAAPGSAEVLDKMTDLLAFTLPRYAAEGKSYLTIAIGCTGGRHRSVALSIALAARLRQHAQAPVAIVHRDCSRGGTVTQMGRPLTGDETGAHPHQDR